MKKNMGTVDRVLRLVFAAAVGALILAGTLSGVLAYVLGALALVLLATSAVGTCPLYLPFGISTARRKD